MTMSTSAPSIWLNGRLGEPELAAVPMLTPALHYGLGVFEGIRCYATADGPAIFRLREHMARLVQSASVLGFRRLPYSVEDLCSAAAETVRHSGLANGYIRPLIYLAGGGWDLNIDSGEPHCAIAVWEWNAYLGQDAQARGIRANVSSFTRHHPNVFMTKAKSCGNYVNSCLAKTESRRLGFDEAIMLDPQGHVAECTGENIFIVKDGELSTPLPGAILEGITRATIMHLARERGLAVRETTMGRDMLYTADEVFVCGTAAEVAGLAEIDFRTIGSGAVGPVTRMLQDAYHHAVRGEDTHANQWLTWIETKPDSGRLSADAPAA
jgi:branched-chain amino acid aminotransferase